MKRICKHVLAIILLTLYSQFVGYGLNFIISKTFSSHFEYVNTTTFGAGGALLSVLGFSFIIPSLYLIMTHAEVKQQRIVKIILMSPLVILIFCIWEILEVVF